MKKSKKLSHQALLKINSDPASAARAADLVHVKDSNPGISRATKGKAYVYLSGKKQVKDKATLERIRKLAIPPSWKEVWICSKPNGHIQATGLDLKGRKQYRYHADWNNLRSETKFHHLYEFGKILPGLRKRIKKDIAGKILSREKVLATVIDLMDKTYIRIGNSGYEKMNGSYGLTTLKDRHVKFGGGEITFSFTGKKGVDHAIRLKDKQLAKIVKECRDIPGKTLFQYYDGNGERKSIDSGMVNSYIKDLSSIDFSAKDFRTWAGSVKAVEFLRDCDHDDLKEKTDKQKIKLGKKTAVDMLDAVSNKLGNTRSVCKKYYVHPQLITLCEENASIDKISTANEKSQTFTREEKLLMCILKKAI
ncbi:MAG: DNA topoisomerase IB [Chitinophagaceae bacterium]